MFAVFSLVENRWDPFKLSDLFKFTPSFGSFELVYSLTPFVVLSQARWTRPICFIVYACGGQVNVAPIDELQI